MLITRFLLIVYKVKWIST